MNPAGPATQYRASDDAVNAMLADDIAFGHYAFSIWRHRWLVVAVALGCALVAGLVASLASPLFEASTTLSVAGSKLADQASPVTTANFLPLIENNSVAARVVREFGLGRAPYSLTPEVFLGGAMSVEDIRNSNLIKVHVRLPDASMAAKVANRVGELAVDSARTLSQKEAVQARDELQGEVAQAKRGLDEASARLQAFRTSAQIELTREDVKAMLEQRAELPDLFVELEAARAKVRRGEAELAARQRVDALTRSIDTDPAMAEAARAGGAAPESILGLKVRSEEVNEVYQAIEKQLVEDRAELAALETRRAQLIDVRKLSAGQQSRLTELYRKEAELDRLTTEYEVAQNSYKDIAAQYDTARLQIATRSAQLQLIDPAIVPSAPQPKHVLRDAAFAMLAGATLIILLILLIQATMDLLGRAARGLVR